MNRKFRSKNSIKRKSRRIREVKSRILIVCEGEKTEPKYFRAFRISSVKVEGDGLNTLSLVDYANTKKQEAENNGEDYDQVWCVFDKDDFSDCNFNNAVNKAESQGMKVAYSNEAFELWYLLHFIYIDTQLKRNAYIEKLNQHLDKKYRKNSEEMYDLLLPYQDDAIRNAKKLCLKCNCLTPADSNPSTKVFLLVKELNKHIG